MCRHSNRAQRGTELHLHEKRRKGWRRLTLMEEGREMGNGGGKGERRREGTWEEGRDHDLEITTTGKHNCSWLHLPPP